MTLEVLYQGRSYDAYPVVSPNSSEIVGYQLIGYQGFPYGLVVPANQVTLVGGGNQPIISSPTAPASPVAGQIWMDTSATPSLYRYWNGSAWILLGPTPPNATSTASPTPPSSPTVGQIWLDTAVTPNLYRYWNGSAWILLGPTVPSSTNPPGGGGGGGGAVVSGGGAAVTSFNGRSGAIAPQQGDYTAAMVGAEPAGTAASAIAAHNSALDPHPQYLTPQEGDLRYFPVNSTLPGYLREADVDPGIVNTFNGAPRRFLATPINGNGPADMRLIALEDLPAIPGVTPERRIAKLKKDGGAIIPGGQLTILDGFSVVTDPLSLSVPAEGRFVAPLAGIYSVIAALIFVNQAVLPTNNGGALYCISSLGQALLLDAREFPAGAGSMSFSGSTDIVLAAGESIRLGVSVGEDTSPHPDGNNFAWSVRYVAAV
jgi:hypothetical protein